MPAYFETGMFAHEAAWHGMGNVVDFYPGTWKEARKLAELNWDAVAAPAYEFSGLDSKGKITWDAEVAVSGAYRAMTGKQRIVRNDTGATIGVPGINYEIIDHNAIGEIVEALNTDPNVKYETLVVLEGGAHIVAVIRLDEPRQIQSGRKKDSSLTLPYVALSTRHDGTGACKALATSVRIVCANTARAADWEAEGNGTVFTFRHARSWRERIPEAQQALAGARSAFHDYVDFAEHMMTVKFGDLDIERFLELWMPIGVAGDSKRRVQTVLDARGTYLNILNSDTCAGIVGTGYGAYQAATEWADHYAHPGASQDSYVTRQLIDTSRVKRSAARYIRELSAIA